MITNIKINKKYYDLNEFIEKFHKKDWFKPIYPMVIKIEPQSESTEMIDIILSRNKKRMTIQEYRGNLLIEDRIIRKKEKKKQNPPKEDKYKNRLQKFLDDNKPEEIQYPKKTQTKPTKKKHKVDYVIDLRKIRSLQRNAFVEKYSSHALERRKNKGSYKERIDNFLQKNCPERYKKQIIKKSKSNLEKTLKEVQNITIEINNLLEESKSQKIKSTKRKTLPSAYPHLIQGNNKKYKKTIYSYFSLGD